MSQTFIPRFLAAGGRLAADVRVNRLQRSNGRWRITACHAPRLSASRNIEISADKVFVACGAIHTPSLLRRSGLTWYIGNSLRFHPMLKAVAMFAEVVQRPGDPDPVTQLKHFKPQVSKGCSH